MIKFTPKIYETKSKGAIQIRMLKPEEGQQLIDLKLSYIKGTSTIPMYETEYQNDAIAEAQLIRDYNDSDNSILLVAEANGQLIGNIDLTGSKRRKMYHTAMIGMGIQVDWRNQSVGKHLLASVLAWATAQATLEIIWLEVYATNIAGINLYQKMGFQECGKIKNFFKEKDVNIDKITMTYAIKK